MAGLKRKILRAKWRETWSNFKGNKVNGKRVKTMMSWKQFAKQKANQDLQIGRP